MTGRRHGASRDRHHGQRGFTLVEMLVTISILTVVVGVIGAAYGVGLKIISPGGARDRLAGVHDQMTFEKLLGRDVSRASCILVPGSPGWGSCAHGFANATVQDLGHCGGARLCVAWPQVSDLSCHVAAYSVSTSGLTKGEVLRNEYAVSPAGVLLGVSARGVTTKGQPVVGLTITAATAASPTGGTWVSLLTVVVRSTGLANPPTGTLQLRPLVTDPAGPGASIGATGPPC